MNVDIKQAIKLFFPNPSLEMVFFEAIMNSLDAEATEVDITISIEEFAKPETLNISIRDNGVGFTNERFEKFNNLLRVEEESHKGVGRLVYLSYFKKANFVSNFVSKQRSFQFSDGFKGKSDIKDSNEKSGTVITLTDYYRKKIASHDYLKPGNLIKRIKEEFYPRLYLLKKEGKEVTITISLNVINGEDRYEFQSDKRHIKASELPELKIAPIDVSIIKLFEKAELHYSITKKEYEKTIITALCVDGRSLKQEIISDENIPLGYEIIFLLNSDLFTGQVDPSRQTLTVKETILKPIITLFRNKVAEILKKEIPALVEKNKETREDIINKFPHLLDYVEVETIGFVKREDTIKKAQDKFFKDQKEILEAPESLDEKTFDKTLEISARLLTEYILYRQIIINRLRKITPEDDELAIHKLIIPPGKKYNKEDLISDIYSNNAWLLDDKYMTYSTILSDKVMKQVVKEITKDEANEAGHGEPDIAIIFSGNPDSEQKVDVVIVELKRKGVSLDENVTAITQLQTRATKLMDHYPNKIQRIWFYAIIDIDAKFELYLTNNRFIKLFSSGSSYYREDSIKTNINSEERHTIAIHIINYDAFVEDSSMRNSAFLNILKSNFRDKVQKGEQAEIIQSI